MRGRSGDNGATVSIAAQFWNNGEGDARWEHLLPTDAGLLVFGYRRDAQKLLAELPHGVVGKSADGTLAVLPLAPTHGLKSVLVVGCWPVSAGGGGGDGRECAEIAPKTRVLAC